MLKLFLLSSIQKQNRCKKMYHKIFIRIGKKIDNNLALKRPPLPRDSINVDKVIILA